MANTFMIEVHLNGQAHYANVYLYTKGSTSYHVNFIGDDLPEYLSRNIILVDQDEELKPLRDDIPKRLIEKIISAIRK